MPIQFLKNWTIDLTKLPQYTNFKGKFEVELDYNLLLMIGQSTNPVFTDERKRLLLTLLNKINKNTNILEITHNQRFGIGRFYADNQISPICISRHIKHTLFQYLDWIDIDMIKGHSTILYNIAKNNNIQVLAIKHYLEEFDTIITELQEFYTPDDSTDRISSDNIKDIFCRLIYGGSIKTWFEDLDKEEITLKTNIIHPFISDFKKDIDRISTLVYLNNNDLIQKIKGDLVDDWKIKSRTMSYFCGAIENEIIHITYKVLHKNNAITPKHFALEFDGLCFPRPADIDLDDLIFQVNTEILKKTGLEVKMKFKPYNPIYVHNEIIESRISMPPPLAIAHELHNQPAIIAGITEFDTLQTIDTYDQFKLIFERSHFKCRSNSLFYKEEFNEHGIFTKLIAYTEHSLKVANREFNYFKINSKGTKTIKYFIDEWFDDRTIRVYDSMDCFPPPLRCAPNIYNTWKPFDVEVLHALQKDANGKCIVNEEDQEYINSGCEFIKNHIRIITGNDPIAFDYFMRWLGFIFKYPSEKCTMPHMVGGMGAGKSELLNFISYMIGESKVIKSTEPDKDVWGHFNGRMSSAYLVILEELTEKKTTEYDSIIKDLITGSLISINQKGEKPYDIKSFHKFISASNTTTIKTVKGDRRNFMMMASNELIGNQEYFKQLRKYTKDQRIQQIFHEQLIMDDSLEDFKSQVIPVTEYQKTLQNSNRDEVDLYLEHVVRKFINSNIKEIQSMEMYTDFTQWKEANGYEYKCTCTKFIKSLKLASLPDGAVNTHLNDKTLHRRDANYLRINIDMLRVYYSL
jgi:nicotinamide mononucleotide adenylyltransferase